MPGPQVPQIPPLPAVPLVRLENGDVTREWYRWFAQVANVLGMLNSNENQPAPFPIPADVGLSPDQVAGLTFALLSPASSGLTSDDAATSGVFTDVPGDTVSADQIAMQALMMSVPH